MSKPLVSDRLWAIIAPLLSPKQPEPKGGRPRIADRVVLTGILFALKSGIAWEMLPQGLGAAVASPTGDVCATGNRRAE